MHRKDITQAEYQKANQLANEFIKRCKNAKANTLEFELAICLLVSTAADKSLNKYSFSTAIRIAIEDEPLNELIH